MFAYDFGTSRLTGTYPNGIAGYIPGAVGGFEYMQLLAGHMAPHTHGYYMPGSVGSPNEGGPYHGNIPTLGLNNTDGGAGLNQTPFSIVPPGIALGCWIAKL